MIKPLIALALVATSTAALAAQERYSVIFGGKKVGSVVADTTGQTTAISYDVKNNGRGPTFTETLTMGADGLPTRWDIVGTTTFGSKASERFERRGRVATWSGSAEKGQATADGLYVAANGSPYSLGLYARALLRDSDGRMAALPGGELSIEKGDTLTISGTSGALPVTAYFLTGLSTQPSTILLDAQNRFVGQVSPRSVVIREGYEGDEVRLRGLAATWSTARLAKIQQEAARRYDGPVRITNVRVFDPVQGALTPPRDVVVNGREIAAVMPAGSPATPGEVTINGAGGTLVAGLGEAHGHIGEEDAMLNLLAGITTVRDMGNDNAVLNAMIGRIERGEMGGPRIVRAGFIEGKSPFSANNGFVVDSEAKAVEAVRWYAARGFWAIKIYNSINPAWVPAMIREAHALGLKAIGHVPAFTTADAMIDAGYDEVTHLNQLALGWVIKPNEDTRTLFRITAQQRLPTLSLDSPAVQSTIAKMANKRVGLDDTLVIHEWLFRSRDGQPQPQVAAVIDHLPIGDQRDARQAVTDLQTIGGDANARATFAQLQNIMRRLIAAGIPLWPGTDMGGSFAYHRELELYQQLGMKPADILRRATLDLQKHFGRDQALGSIERGKLADFFLVTGDPTKDISAVRDIAMVVKDGTFYFPAQIYPKFGIKPFTSAPAVRLPSAADAASGPSSGGAPAEGHGHFFE